MGVRTTTRWVCALAALVAATAALGATVSGAQAAEDPLHMVALGDSSVAGPLVGRQNDLACLRSDENWARVAAAQLGAELTDVSCSGAVTADLTGKRFGYIPPQLDAVTAEADIVTLAIGANDLRMGQKVPSCLNPLPEPAGFSCKDRLTAGGDPTDAELDAVAPRIAAAVQEIRRRAPQAQVFLTGYLTYWQPGGCWPKDPIWARDADYLQSIFDRIGLMLADVAAGNGATYVDITEASRGHGVCASRSAKWMEGWLPTSLAAPYHPNAIGMQAAGTHIAAAISR